MHSFKRPIVCLMGPTASGKTQLAVKLVKQFPFEIISVDSAMVYRGMDIGTAKPAADVLAIAPHHLINIRDPSEAYSAAQFRVDALHVIEDIISRDKVPLLVGGTMLYFRALQKGLAEIPAANFALRTQLSAEGLELGWPALHTRLMKIDPLAAARIHPHDSQRIQRALEVYLATGKNLTTWQQAQEKKEINYNVHYFSVAPKDRFILHARIAQRFSLMLETGLVQEVEKLYVRKELSLETPAMRAVGYRQVWEYLEGKLTWEEMREKGIIATRQLAKRQLTWLRSWPNVQWFESEADDLLAQITPCLQQLR